MKLKKKQNHKKTEGKKLNQLGLPRLTHHSRHEIRMKLLKKINFIKKIREKNEAIMVNLTNLLPEI